MNNEEYNPETDEKLAYQKAVMIQVSIDIRNDDESIKKAIDSCSKIGSNFGKILTQKKDEN